KKAKALNTTSILRVFVIDSHALTRSIELINRVEPDFVEVLPGIASKAIKVIGDETNAKVIAGGLIKEQDEVKQAINSGAKYITSSDRSLW
ncbi:MAG TPA: glycerol-3-phosphate responsive antiterminator, partial [Staphylococcus kloosii]